MRTTILIAFCLLQLTICFCQEKKNYYPNGNLLNVYSEKNGKKSGIYKEYYENGQLNKEINFTDGKKNGVEKEYYESGKIKFENIYKDGKVETTKQYREDGILTATNIHTYINGIELINSKSYHSNGQVADITNYKQDKLDGEYKLYNWNQKPKSDNYYVDDKSIILEGVFKNNNKIGVWKEYLKNGQINQMISYEKYYSNGQLELQITYKENKLTGLYETFFENGQLKEKTSYRDGKKNGTDTIYSTTGQLFETNEYNNDKLIVNNSYYNNGQLYSSISNINGEKIEKTYYENGQLHYCSSIKNGKNFGDWKMFYKNNSSFNGSYYVDDKNIQKETYFVNGKRAKDNSYYENGKLKSKSIFNDVYNQLSTEVYNEDGKLKSITYYNEKNNKTTKTEYYNAGKIEKTEYLNDNGVVINTTYNNQKINTTQSDGMTTSVPKKVPQNLKGVYVEVFAQGDFTGELVADNQGNNTFYLLNKNGVILKANGSSSSNAFRNPESGMGSGRIKTGNYETSNGNIIISWYNGTKDVWEQSYGAGIMIGNGKKLKFIEMVD